MIRRYVILGSAATAVVLSSCGGGGSSTATSTATATATPTPTPTATYTSFPLSSAAEFYPIDAGVSYTGDPTAGAVTLGPTYTEQVPNPIRVSLAVPAVVASDTPVIDESTEESRFATSTLKTAPTPSVQEFVYYSTDTSSTASAGNFAQLEFLNNLIKSSVATESLVTTDSLLGSLGTVSYANWWRGDSTTAEKRLTYTVWGYRTVTTDMPTTGTSSYTTRIIGRTISVANNATTILRLAGTATTSVNFATGLVTMTLNLTTTDSAGGTETPYLTLTAQGALPINQNQFTGSITGSSTAGSTMTGTIAGGFFGAVGANIGVVFGASGTVNGADTRIVGEVVGKKQ